MTVGTMAHAVQEAVIGNFSELVHLPGTRIAATAMGELIESAGGQIGHSASEVLARAFGSSLAISGKMVPFISSGIILAMCAWEVGKYARQHQWKHAAVECTAGLVEGTTNLLPVPIVSAFFGDVCRQLTVIGFDKLTGIRVGDAGMVTLLKSGHYLYQHYAADNKTASQPVIAAKPLIYTPLVG